MYVVLMVLVVTVVFVNGWTDAPNSITCVVATGALPYRKAVQMAAVCSLGGILVMNLVNASVANTIGNLVRLEALQPKQSVAVLCAAMCGVIIFVVGAWFFGIPTSESHALIAALTGAALSMNRFSVVNLSAWGKVLWGLGLSLVLGLAFGWMFTKVLGFFLRRANERSVDRLQVVSAAGMAFMNGAQDGQKFIAVFVLARCLSQGTGYAPPATLREHLLTILFCAAVMSLGTLMGARRIITNVGNKMVKLEKYQGACADLGGALCLLIASLFGIPVSPTHTKTTAIMGAGAAVSGSRVDGGIIREMLFAWVFTFPVCGAIGYLLAGVFLRFM